AWHQCQLRHQRIEKRAKEPLLRRTLPDVLAWQAISLRDPEIGLSLSLLHFTDRFARRLARHSTRQLECEPRLGMLLVGDDRFGERLARGDVKQAAMEVDLQRARQDAAVEQVRAAQTPVRPPNEVLAAGYPGLRAVRHVPPRCDAEIRDDAPTDTRTSRLPTQNRSGCQPDGRGE